MARGERVRPQLLQGVDTDRNGPAFDHSAQIFMSVAHDEYWSAAARQR